jgi:hypothetical protein
VYMYYTYKGKKKRHLADLQEIIMLENKDERVLGFSLSSIQTNVNVVPVESNFRRWQCGLHTLSFVKYGIFLFLLNGKTGFTSP